MDYDHIISLAAGIVAAGILAVLALASPGLLRTEGALSASKLQFFLWTEAALFTYGFLFTAYAIHHTPLDLKFKPQIPTNIVLLMGLSITAAAASQSKPQPPGVKTDGAFARFFQNANGQVALPKVQMLAWTFIAIAVYLFTAVGTYYSQFHDNATPASYPDVDTALLALVGLAQGAFVGNRFLDKESTD